MYHDQFPEFLSTLRETLITPGSETKEIMDTLINIQDRISEIEGDELYKKFDESPEREKWNKAVFDFMLKTEVFRSYP